VVNGKIWPLLEVQAATYRFRIINGSNASTFRLVLLHDGQAGLGRITHTGTDHGLLHTPARLPPDGLVLVRGSGVALVESLNR
jgi:spore coat protein A